MCSVPTSDMLCFVMYCTFTTLYHSVFMNIIPYDLRKHKIRILYFDVASAVYET